MAHWGDELEGMRPRLREEADAFVASFAADVDDPSLPVPERIARQRAAHDGRVLHSEMAADREISGPAGPVRLRTFVPDQVDAVFLHIHGGGFVTGSPEMTDLLHEMLSKELKLAFVSVDYRLAPEHPYPAGPDDCEAAAVWLLEHAEPELGSDRLLIGGESAGAHLAACTLLRMRDRHDAVDRFRAANLVFGIYDLSGTPSQRATTGRPDLLTVEQIEYFTALFTPGKSTDERRDPDISPLYADLRGLPPALFTVGADDHLVDDTLFMAARWQLAGNDAELLVYPESPHGCIGMPSVFEPWFATLKRFLRHATQE
ncbi:MAG TPA: alpha/beta hydrolase [Acidimicrobiia bacterium]